jgi:short-subunit dehydrogenase
MKYALVSGGSKGIGFAIASALAKRNFNLVLVARNEKELNDAKSKLEGIYPVHVEVLPYDMGDSESAEKIVNWCSEKDLPVSVLCNVTGLGGSADYLTASLADSLYMLRLNTEPAVSLIYYLLPILRKNQPAYILNVSSMAGFAPILIKNIYSASKAAMIFFSYSLRYQLKKDQISVSCLCPGPVFTKPEVEQETIKKLGWLGRQLVVPVEIIGDTAINQTLKKTMIIIPGTMAKMVSFLIRILPRRIIAFIYYRLSPE